MKKLATISPVLLCAFVGSVSAQTEMPPPPSVGPNMKMLVPMLKAQLEALSSPELLEAQSKYYRELYLSLKKQGFTDEQAMQLLVALASSGNSK